MPSGPTGAMRQLEDHKRPRDAGLVLLYAEEYQSLPAGYLLPEQGVVVVGRGEGVDISLNVAAVSRRHATLVLERGRALLRDTGSTNGTFVDGVRIGELELEAGMEVRIGDAFFKYVEEEASCYICHRLDGSMMPGARRRAPADTALIGGFQMDRIASELAQVASSELSVMILGESGTGKEVAADRKSVV